MLTSLLSLSNLPSLSLSLSQFPSAQGASYQTLQSNLSACAAALNVAGSEVMTAAKSTPEHQAEASSKFSKTFSEMLTAGLTLAGASKVWAVEIIQNFANVKNTKFYQKYILYVLFGGSADCIWFQNAGSGEQECDVGLPENHLSLVYQTAPGGEGSVS